MPGVPRSTAKTAFVLASLAPFGGNVIVIVPARPRSHSTSAPLSASMKAIAMVAR
jgi:hypothetical protein